MEVKHRLFLSMYTFQIKKRNTSNKNVIDINDFLSMAYPELQNKFEKGFVQDIIHLFDFKLFKSKGDTHGGILEEKSFSSKSRTLDLMINGGAKGLKQYLINEEGEKEEISDKEIVGLKFFARIWLPAGTNVGYLFIQRYSGASLKPLFDTIIDNVLSNHNLILAGRTIEKTTTKKRQEKFLKEASVSKITVLVSNSKHDTGVPSTQTANIALKNISLKKEKVNMSSVKGLLKSSGINVEGSFSYNVLYQSESDGYKEEKTVKGNENYSLIPNTPITSDCIDANNHPIFEKMQQFTTSEMEQILKEAKLG